MSTTLRLLIASAVFYAVFTAPGIRAEVILHEDFESGELGSRWERGKEDPARGDFETRPEFVHSGRKSYRLTALAYQGEAKILKGYPYKESSTGLSTWFLQGYDTVFVRWYAKFAADFDQGKNMHWIALAGLRADNPRSMLGKAGQKSDGTDRFIANVEPSRMDGESPPGQLCFYTYWPDMEQSADGYYWGNKFFPEKPFPVERNRWYCFEMMVKCNEPGKKNGEQALWVDGQEIMRVTGLRWRDTDKLKINFLSAGLYIHYCERDCTYWLDDLVISTEYVGPMER